MRPIRLALRAAVHAPSSLRPSSLPVRARSALRWASPMFAAATLWTSYAAHAEGGGVVGRPRKTPAELVEMPTAPVELAKRAAGRKAVDDYVRSGMVVGVGSGSTIVYAVQRLAERVRTGELSGVVFVPTSFQARELVAESGLPLGDLTLYPALDVAIDGADEVDPALNCIKGGGACQTQEKLVAAAARRFVLIADHRKQSAVLGSQWKTGVPVEVLPEAHVLVRQKLEALGAKPKLRMAVRKAGPVVTDNGNLVLDVDLGEIRDPAAAHAMIKLLPGVVETGLFVGMAERAYFGQADGSVVEWTLPKRA